MPILARILKDRGIVTERQLQEAIQHQVLYGGRLGTSLHELGFITEERLHEALSKAHGVPTVVVDPRLIDPEVVKLVPKAMAADRKVFPYRVSGKTLSLLMVDPSDHSTVAKIGYSRGFIVKRHVVPEFRMIQLLRDWYGIDERWRYTDTRHPAAPEPAVLSPEEAAARLDSAASRDEVVEAVLALAHKTFRRVIFFIVREPWVVGWSALGEGVDRERAAALRIPLDQPSLFRAVARDKTPFVGRPGPETENERFLREIGKRPGTNMALLPVLVRGRVVNLVYGDAGPAGQVKADLGDLILALQKASKAYLRIIRARIAEAEKIAGRAAPPA
ncbi:MAG: hypothetical protein KJ067_16880 [Vicinamibacteria bacterium]|nr:hypothetical protein [Vicinamibacteria bacterium]